MASLSGTYFSPFQGSLTQTGASGGLWIHILAFFYLEWFSSKSFEWIIPLNFPYSIEWIFFGMNILDFVLNWIIFRPVWLKKLNFQKRSPILKGEDFPWQAVAQLGLAVQALLYPWMCYTEIHVETSLISILLCCLPSLPHLSSLLMLFLQLSRVHLLQQCRVAGV